MAALWDAVERRDLTAISLCIAEGVDPMYADSTERAGSNNGLRRVSPFGLAVCMDSAGIACLFLDKLGDDFVHRTHFTFRGEAVHISKLVKMLAFDVPNVMAFFIRRRITAHPSFMLSGVFTHAVQTGDVTLIDALIEQGHPPNMVDNNIGLLPTHTAVYHGSLGVLHRLLQAGADPSSQIGGTPLLTAALSVGNEAAASMILQAGAVPGPDTHSPATEPLLSAVKWLPSFVGRLLATGRFNGPNHPHCVRAVKWALFHRDATLLEAILDMGVDIEAARAADGQCMLGIALREVRNNASKLACARAIVDRSINAGNGALPCEVRNQCWHLCDTEIVVSPHAVRFLLAHGADPERAYHGSLSVPIHYAIMRGSCESVAVLLDAGADIYSSDRQRTVVRALDMAMRVDKYPSGRMLTLLADAGFDFSDIGVTELSRDDILIINNAGGALAAVEKHAPYLLHPWNSLSIPDGLAAERQALFEAVAPYVGEDYVAQMIADCVYIPRGRRAEVYANEREALRLQRVEARLARLRQ